ncbi:ribosomal RNA adenine dimethylase family protein [Mycobacterium xenopi 4042]|uniref:Ribosomal RNA adenine dimethylase family protein n=1 Tax=Mycobacterium xenopi 4042 TaxID=1299334 RepID=X8AG24_MYCXE|nr:ribosomal RNA adenine dimethylase family protein [Mycobacterium xenopi 4042]
MLDRGATVTAVEIDPALAGRLRKTVAEHSHSEIHRLTVLNRDVLSIRRTDLAAEPTAVVANLPYNVAVPALLHLLAEFPSVRTVMVMVQAEVAERLAAEPGSKDYGVPSVKVSRCASSDGSAALAWCRRRCSGRSRGSTPGWCASTATRCRRGPPTSCSASVSLNWSTPHLHSGARHLATPSPNGRARAMNPRSACSPPASTLPAVARRCRSRTSCACCSAPVSGTTTALPVRRRPNRRLSAVLG